MLAPILARTMLFLQQGHDPATSTIRRLDFNLVETSLGPMVECATLYRNGGNVAAEDVHDTDYTGIRVLSDTELSDFAMTTALNACCWPRLF